MTRARASQAELAQCAAKNRQKISKKLARVAGPRLALEAVMTSMRTPLGAGLLVLVLGLGCGSASKLDGSVPCSSDADCESDQVCKQGQAPHETPAVVAPNPCLMLTPCNTSEQCTGGYVCSPYTSTWPGSPGQCPAKVCQAPCTDTSCPADQVCGSDGACAFQPCDEQGAPACDEFYHCDTAAASATTTLPPVTGSLSASGTDAERERLRGCVRTPCDEEGGFVCSDNWRCAPDEATNEGSGCVPVPCGETGHCSNDQYYICEPTSDGRRPVGTDPQGCVLRNCEEGFTCQYILNTTNYSVCKLDDSRADDHGCVVQSCEEQPECVPGLTCDPGTPISDLRGCRSPYCDEPDGLDCGQGYVCDRASPEASAYGCRVDPSATGGTGGAGGAGGAGGVGGVGGVGGAGTGGISAGGAGGSSAQGGIAGTSGSAGASGAGAVSGNAGTGGGSGAGGSGGSSGSVSGGSSGTAGAATGTCVARN
jgi:hypothetical protein